MSANQPYTCHEYRKEMILLGLRNRLNSPELSEEEKQGIQAEIRRLEEEIGMA
jgi:hypothetical protein